MGMPAPKPITTIAELLALPEDGKRHELLDGVHVVTPTPRLQHQRAAREVSKLLENQCEEDPDLEVFGVPGDIQLNDHTVAEPDAFVLRRNPDKPYQSWADAPIPLLAVEILSPSTASRDRGIKRRLYLEAGVEEYWIVDIDAQLVERWRQGDERPEIVHETLAWSLSPGVAGSIDLIEFFKRVLR